MKNNKKIILKTYGENDLGNNPIFQGGYINFGYWDNKKLTLKKEINSSERIEASMTLYDQIYERLNIVKDDKILEVGCGKGLGCKRIIEKYNIHSITGIDITPNQITHAHQLCYDSLSEANKERLNFKISACDNTPFINNTFSKIFAVESPQHFPSLENFAKEAFRLLHPQGILAFTAHFSTSVNSFQILKDYIPLINNGLDLLVPIEYVRTCFIRAGFKEIEFTSIGDKVFEGFNKWILQVGDAPWGENFLKMFKEGHLDYFILAYKKERAK